MIVAKYKFDKSIYENLIPVFNDGYEGYSISDEIDSENENHIIRTIECDTLPTEMRFGQVYSEGEIVSNASLSLLEVYQADTSSITNAHSMFRNCKNMISIGELDTSNVTDMYDMFSGCTKLTSLDVSNWNTSEVTSIGGMFYGCNNLISLDVSNWNTSNVTAMNNIFRDCKSLTSLDISNFNTSNVTNIRGMFYNCNKLTSLDISNFDTSKVTNTTDVFTNTPSLQYIRCNNTSTINTLAPLLYNRTSSTQGKIITTSSTNVDTTALSSLNWSVDTSSGTKIAEYKFDKSIWNYFIPKFNEGYSGYFVNDRIEDEVNNPNVVTRELVGYGGLPTQIRFGDTSFNVDTDIKDKYNSLRVVNYINTSNCVTLAHMFRGCMSLTNVNGVRCDSNINDINYLCYHCGKLTSIDVSNWDTSNVTSIWGMFDGCTNLTLLDVSNWNTSNVTRMPAAFAYCTNLTSLDVSNWDTSKITDMQSMFRGCTSLTSLDVSNWNTSNVTGMGAMFYNCHNLTSLDLSNWNVSRVDSMSQMFHNCSKLVSVGDISSWNVNVKHVASMFNNTKITSANLSGWKTSIANPSFMFMSCSNLQYVDMSNVDFSNIPEDNTGSSSGIFKYCSRITDVGLLYCNTTTVQKVIDSATNDKIDITIWVKDTKASDYTATDYVTIKDYKEDNRILYLNSPLLEGDEIVNKEGKLYHYHKMGKEVLDGSKVLFTVVGENYQPTNTNFINFHYLNNNIKKRGEVYSNNFKYVFFGVSSDADTNCIWTHGSNNSIRLCIDKSKLQTTDENGLKQWLQANPTTIVYELTEPYYELISDDPLIVQSYAEGKLDTSSIITPTSIQFVPYEEELTYLYTSTQYCIQFYSTANCTVDITLGGTKVESKSVSVGLNKIYITTPSTLVDNKLIINAKGNATISKVVVVNSNAEFDYFDGLKSSFEDCLVTDVDNENYGKYEVGVKIVGKNKFDGEFELGSINDIGDKYDLDSRVRSVNFNEIKSNTRYIISAPSPTYIALYDENKNFISRIYFNITNYNTFVTPNNVRYFKLTVTNTSNININVQLEEGATATSYEPYKETNATIYLNSPLLKGDRIEVIDGKLCHYHKMGKVVLDGSENWDMHSFSYNQDMLYRFTIVIDNMANGFKKVISNKFSVNNFNNYDSVNIESINSHPDGNLFNLWILKTRLGISTNTLENIANFKQWLSENPTTVVYQLEEPYYEDITPIQSSFVISTVSEGDMEIITDLPIKSNITYLTNITSAVLMEQQLDELDNSTESLTNIVEDEINE